MPGILPFVAGFPITFIYLSARATYGSLKFPNYPFEYMPCSKTPVETLTLAVSRQNLLPSTPLNGVGFHSSLLGAYPMSTTKTHFGAQSHGLYPHSRPASNSRYRVCPRTLLLICWLSFNQVGLSLYICFIRMPEQALQSVRGICIFPDAEASFAKGY